MNVLLINDKEKCEACQNYYSLQDDQECPYCWNKHWSDQFGYVKTSKKAKDWNERTNN